jgi:hypothetical protein
MMQWRCWTLRSLGPFAGDTLVPASLFDCAGVACLLIAQLRPAGLSCPGVVSTSATSQLWRRLNRTPAWGLDPPVVVSSSEPEPAPWSAVAAACPVAYFPRATGGSGALAARALRSAGCWTIRNLAWFASVTLVPARLFYCAGVTCLSITQVGPARLSIQARSQHRLLRKGGGDLI